MGAAVFFDCFSGASGDMLLGALVDAGVATEELSAGLARLPIRGWRIDVSSAVQFGLRGTRARVLLEESADQPHRRLSEVVRIIRAGRLDTAVEDRAVNVFEKLAEVEGFI